jgi:hypothetical protein
MAKLITVITKQNIYDEWIATGPDNTKEHFSQEEIDNVLNPFYEYARNLPGIMPDKYKVYTENRDMTVVREFDTRANAENALVKLSRYSDEPIVIARNALVQQRTKDLGVLYTFVNKII